MKNVIAELDKIAKYLETFDEPWAFHLAYRIDNVTQQIEDKGKRASTISSDISKNVLDSYREEMEFLSSKESKLKDLINLQKTKNANQLYKSLKDHFGKLNKKESIRFIKNVIKTLDK